MKKSDFSRLHTYSTFTTACLSAAVLFCFTACNSSYTKDKYLKNFELFIMQAEENYTNYTNQDWENSNFEYSKFSSELYKKVYAQLTSEDELQIRKLKTRYEIIKVKKDINNTIQIIKDGVEQTSGALKELIEGK